MQANGETDMNMSKHISRHIVGALLLGAAMTNPAAAASYGFDCITNTTPANCGIGASQLYVDIIDAGANQALFTFYNIGADASSIADVHFDDGTLLGISRVINGAGVSFTSPANPGNLPGANNITPAFQTTAGFSADSDAPVQLNGVNPGETVGILFNLQAGKSFADVLSAIGLAGNPGGLRIGLHVQGFAGGGSESFVNTVGQVMLPVPEASQWMMLLAGMGLIAARTLRRS